VNRNSQTNYSWLRLALGALEGCTVLLVLFALLSPISAYARDCGGAGEPACCVGEGPPCDSSELLEIFPCKGDDCGCSSTRCRAKEKCGGAGQRACCEAEGGDNCGTNLTEIAGACSGDDWACLCAVGPLGAAIFSNGRCVSVSPDCGGAGERACCISEQELFGQGACDNDDLKEVAGCVGDCTCPGGISSGMCTEKDAPTIPEPATNVTVNESRECALSGYADLHTHLHADLAHGGNVFSGLPYNEPWGVRAALSGQEDYAVHEGHGTIGGDPIGGGTQDGAGSHPAFPTFTGAPSNMGEPLFNAWPTWSSTTHQQMYYKWLERAYQGGLRLMVMLAVNNLALCRSTGGADCDDTMVHIDAQLDKALEFERYIDRQNDGVVDGDGWFRIVTSPQQAREVIRDGKLAVVLGIEVENLFNCGLGGCPTQDGQSPQDYVTGQVEKYYDMGVRHIFPIHNFDNAFGSPATWQDAINVGNNAVEGYWWEVEECPSTTEGDYGFQVGKFLDIFATFFMNVFGFGGIENVPPHTFPSTCNKFGLRPLGEHLVKQLMDAKIIIDVDHMSNHSLNKTLELAAQRNYPVVATHVQFFELNQQSIRHERMRTKAQLEAIRDSGGMIAAMLKDDQQDTGKTGQRLHVTYEDPRSGLPIVDDCRHSSKTFAQMLQYAVDIMDGPVAFGSDFNGVAGHVGPRFGHQACGRDPAERFDQLLAGNQLEYPFSLPGFGAFDKQVTGQRTFDFNTNGLATVGQLPDLVADLKQVGLSDTYVTALFRSAEEYIKVWEKAEGTYGGTPEAKCIGDAFTATVVEADEYCQAIVSVADDSLAGNPDVALSQEPPGPYPLGGTLVELTATPTLSCDAPTSCQTLVAVADVTPPPITCPYVPPVECDGSTTNVGFPAATLGVDNCGAATLGGCNLAAGSPFNLGSTPVTCTAKDTQGNQGSCEFNVLVQDTTAPVITPSTGQSILECNVDTYTEAGAAAADTCDATVSVQIGGDTVNEALVGSYEVIYAALDASGNSATERSRNVRVQDTTVPAITCSADIAVDPVGPGGTSVSFQATASDICDAAPVVACPDSGNTFGLGTTTEVTCTATDAETNQSACSLLVQVFSEEEVVANLVEAVDQLGESGSLNQGQANSLRANLNNILRSIEQGKGNAACGKLQGFISKIDEWIDDSILSEDEGRPQIESAMNLRGTLSCS